MNFEEFEHLARLYVVGALDDDELLTFAEARRNLGEPAEKFLEDCQELNSVFALSLRPKNPKAETKASLMAKLQQRMQGN